MVLLTEPVPRKCTAGVTPAPSDTASWPPRRPADGQQRAALRERVTGRSPGVYQPPLSYFLYGTSEEFILLVPTHDIRSSHQLTSAQHVPAGRRPP